jgi:hypothetical protein
MKRIPDHLTMEEAALEAAKLASEATAELLRFAREGAASTRTAFEEETVSRLAEACFHALSIEGGPIFDEETQPELFEREARLRSKLDNALRNYVEESEPA